MSDNPSNHRVMVAYQQFCLAPFGHTPILDPRQPGRLLIADPAGPAAIICCGCARGPVNVAISVGKDEFPDLAVTASDWEIAEEMTLQVDDDLYLVELNPEGPVVKVYSPPAPGLHVVQVFARGRATHYDAVVEEPSEDYLITIAPTAELRPRQLAGDDGI